MGQLHISRRDICYFVIYTNNWINIEQIKYDSKLWNSKMADKLQM